MISSENRRLVVTIPKALEDELEEVAYFVTKERGKKCTKSEIVNIALTAFVVGYYNEKEKKQEKEN